MSLGKRAGGFDYNDDAKRLMMAGGGGMMPNAYCLPNFGGGMAMPGFGGAGLGGPIHTKRDIAPTNKICRRT